MAFSPPGARARDRRGPRRRERSGARADGWGQDRGEHLPRVVAHPDGAHRTRRSALCVPDPSVPTTRRSASSATPAWSDSTRSSGTATLLRRRRCACDAIQPTCSTTPESIEVMLISEKTDARRLFAGLSVVIIDEAHAVAGDQRGAHLTSLPAPHSILRARRATHRSVGDGGQPRGDRTLAPGIEQAPIPACRPSARRWRTGLSRRLPRGR